MSERTIKVDYLARVEGEGALHLTWKDGKVDELALSIFEPPRFFEAFLRGREAVEAPDVTARICGICPVAYQMSACQAVEQAFEVDIPEPLHRLRRLLYCGEWIESHVLHIAMLHAPDFFGLPDAMTLARTHKDEVVAALAAKKAGNAIVTMLGGREIHPINVKVGGFWRLPRMEEVDALRKQLEEARPKLEAVVRWTGTFDFPELQRDQPFLALCPGDVYPFIEGPVRSTIGHRFEAMDWRNHVVEEHVERSNALHARLDGQLYQTGPLARFALNFDRLPPGLQQLAREIGATPPVRNPFRSILVRGIEALYAMDEALRILDTLDAATLREEPAVPVTPKAGVGHGVSEAPRGVLYHRYEVDEEGLIVDADIVPPTAQNQLAIEADLWALADDLWQLDHETATLRAEQAIRNYDPCISCATHFLTLTKEARFRIVGLGQPAAGDDGVGLAVLEALSDLDVERVPLRDAAPLVELLDGSPLLLIDAVVGGGEPGSLRWLSAAELGRASLWSTHGLSVPDAIGLAEAVNGPQAAQGLEVLAVCIAAPEGPSFDLSPVIAAAVPRAAEAVRRRLQES